MSASRSDSASQEVGKPAVERAPDDLHRAWLHSGHVEHIPQSSATPQGVPYQVPTHLIRDALDGDVLLMQRHRQQLRVGDGDRMVDHAGDSQLPAGGVESRGQQLRVDPVEVGVLYDERSDARHVQAGAGRQRRSRLDRCWGLLDSCRFARSNLEEHATDGAAGEGGHPEGQRVANEPAARPVGHLGRSAGPTLLEVGGEAKEARKDPPGQAERDREDANRQHRIDQWIPERGHEREQAQGAEAGESRRPSQPSAGACEDPQPSRQEQARDGDRSRQNGLVSLPEHADDQLLGSTWLEGDQQRTDLRDRRGCPRHDPRDQLGDAEREASGQEPGSSSQQPRSDAHLEH